LAAKLAAPADYRDLFEAVGREEGVDPNLLHAIGWHESQLNPAAVSPPNTNGTRDYGLMQINAVNFPALGLTGQTALDPARNVRAAARLLRSIQQLNDSVPDQLAVYNAGPSKVAGRAGGPKLDADGRYINLRYVVEAFGKYLVIVLAHGVQLARKGG
jgi:soluble lytic murein transglycosylase-like protein